MALRAVIAVGVAAGVGAAELKLGRLEYFSDAACTAANVISAEEVVLDTCVPSGTTSSMKATCTGTTLTLTSYSDKTCTTSASASPFLTCTSFNSKYAKGTCGITYTPAAATTEVALLSAYTGDKCDATNAALTMYHDQAVCDADEDTPGTYSWWKCTGGKPWVEHFSDQCKTMVGRSDVSGCQSFDKDMVMQSKCVAKPAKYIKMTVFSDKCEGTATVKAYLGEWCTKLGDASIKVSADGKTATMYKDNKCGVVLNTTTVQDCGTCKEETEDGKKSYTKIECMGYTATVAGSSSATLAASVLAVFVMFSFGSK